MGYSRMRKQQPDTSSLAYCCTTNHY